MNSFLQIFIIIFLMGFVSWKMTTVFHELGHGIIGLLLTRKKVLVFIGTDGKGRVIRIPLWQLKVHIHPNPMHWSWGYCEIGDTQLSDARQILFTLGGPLASLLVAVVSCYFIFPTDMHALWKLFFGVFLCAALWDLYLNLRPNKMPVAVINNSGVYNDGQQLVMLFKLRKLNKVFLPAVALYEEKKYPEAAVILQQIADKNTEFPHVQYMAIAALYMNREYTPALERFTQFKEKYSLTPGDRALSGSIKHSLGMWEDSRKDYDDALDLDPDNTSFLNNRGYLLLSMQQYPDAITDFSKAISLSPDFAYAYNNRGYAKVKTGLLEEGLQDIEKSIGLDPENAYAYRNLGMYHQANGNPEKALELYLKAKEMDPLIEEADDLIKSLS